MVAPRYVAAKALCLKGSRPGTMNIGRSREMQQRTVVHARSTTSLQRVKRSSLAALSAAVALATCVTGGLIAGPALAYPLELDMAVSALPVGNPDAHKHQWFTVTVINGKPGCTVKIAGGEDVVTGTVGADGSFVTAVDVKYHKATQTITAKTERCKGSNERASTDVSLSPGEIHGAPSVKHGHVYDITLDHWLPNHRIDLVATNGKQKQKFTATPDTTGHATAQFTPDKQGLWAIIARQDGVGASITVNVT